MLLALVLVTSLARAQGGPPFITDDPGTPGNHHWEINFGWEADHNPGNAYYETPDIDMNFGWGDRIQLKYELPMAVATDPNNTTRAGLGESLLGIKWRPFEYHTKGEPKSDENLLFCWLQPSQHPLPVRRGARPSSPTIPELPAITIGKSTSVGPQTTIPATPITRRQILT